MSMTNREIAEYIDAFKYWCETNEENGVITLPKFICEHIVEILDDTNARPHGEWIAKNEYRRGWHDAITKALSEMMKVHVENETFDMVQKETLIGLGLSMDSALGAEPYSETEESYPEPDRPHGEWIEKHCDYGVYYCCSNCHKMPPNYECDYKEGAIKTNFCPNCGADMRKEGEQE